MSHPRGSLPDRLWEDVERMVGVDEALARILEAVSPLPPERIPILDALDLVLSEDVVACNNIPSFQNSAMDGYAVRAIDTVDASTDRPRSLKVIGNLPAGTVATTVVTEATAIRIMTGAPLPPGADAVVRFEETNEGDRGEAQDRVAILRSVSSGANIRPAGEDVRAGELALRAGTRLRPAAIGLLAALNRSSVAVHRRPRVAILSTGNEVVGVDAPLRDGQIRDSNSYTLAAMTRRRGGVPLLLGVARDAIGDLRTALNAARGADLIVTSGGVSAGDFDVVKDVLQAEGRIAIWQVRMKPGKPLAFGRIGDTPLLGLPGNPVAAAVSFEQFARPIILKLLGRRDLAIPTVEATVQDRIENRGGRRHYVRAVVVGSAVDGYLARVAGDRGSGVLTSLVQANGLLVVPEYLALVEPGMRLPVQMIDWDDA